MSELNELLANRRRCWHVDDSMWTPKGFIPAIVFEDDPGFWPAVGGEGSLPYYWGDTIELARRACDSANADLGLTPQQADEIVASSITAQVRRDARRDAAQERMERLRRGVE